MKVIKGGTNSELPNFFNCHSNGVLLVLDVPGLNTVVDKPGPTLAPPLVSTVIPAATSADSSKVASCTCCERLGSWNKSKSGEGGS